MEFIEILNVIEVTVEDRAVVLPRGHEHCGLSTE
jgi:hypothetical protein